MSAEIFPFHVPTRVIFGPGVLAQAGKEFKTFGQRALIVTGREAMQATGILGRLQEILEAEGVTSEVWAEALPNPTCQLVDQCVERARSSGCDIIVALGGGSALDAGKAAAVLVGNEAQAADYLDGNSPAQPGIPCVAIPTTAGTGSEVTNNAVLTDTVRRLKTSIRGEHLYPRVALVDPELTLWLPPDLTAATGMDALTQHVEGLVSKNANPVTDTLAIRGVGLIAQALPMALEDGDDIGARSSLALASMTGGVVLNNSGLGVAHGLSHPLGAIYDLPHGMLCAVLLPYVIEYNLEVAAQKYAMLAPALGIAPERLGSEEVARRVHQAICELSDRAGIPPSLRELGVLEEDLPQVAEMAMRGSTLKNPRPPTQEDLLELLEEAY